MSQKILHPGTLLPVFLRLDSGLQIRDGILELPVLDQIIGIHRRILLQSGSRNTVLVHLIQDILGFIEPTHLGITTGLPQTGLGHDLLVLRVMTSYIGKGSGGLQEIGIVELRLSHDQPTIL